MNNCPYFFILICSSFLFLNGCVTVPQSYTPSTSLNKNTCHDKYDISYSLSYISDGDVSIGRASESRMREIIEKQLKQSNYFSSVTYQDPAEKSRYHIHFIAHYSMCPVNESAEHGLLVGYTFCLIPTWQNMYLDLSAVLIRDNRKIYSVSTSENLRCYIWLPLAPFGLIWNNWISWTVQEKKCINYLLNNIIDFQINILERHLSSQSLQKAGTARVKGSVFRVEMC